MELIFRFGDCCGIKHCDGFAFGTEGLSHETRVRGLRSLKQVFYRPIYFPNCYTIQKVKNWKGNAYEEEKTSVPTNVPLDIISVKEDPVL